MGPEKIMQPNQPLPQLLKKLKDHEKRNLIGFLIIDEFHLCRDWYVVTP